MSLVVQCELCGTTYGDRDEGTTLIAGYHAMAALVDDHPSRVAQVDCCFQCADILGLPNNGHIDTEKAREALIAILAAFLRARRVENGMRAAVKRKPLITIEQAIKMEEDMWSRGSPADDR